MNAHQRRKQRRIKQRINRFYVETFGCTQAEFFSGTSQSKGLWATNGSLRSAKTWTSKTPQQILEDFNKLFEQEHLLHLLTVNSNYGKFAKRTA